MLKYIISFVYFVFIPLLGYCEEITIPGANLSFDLSSGWDVIDRDGFSNLVDEAKKHKGMEQIQTALDISKTYGFLKSKNNKKETVNSNIVVLTVYAGDEVVDLDDTLEGQIPSKSRVSGVIDIIKGECPIIRELEYACLTQYSQRGDRSTTQYHYLIMSNDYLTQISLNAATKKEVSELENIIFTLRLKKSNKPLKARP